MKRWRRRIVFVTTFIALVCAIVFETVTHVGRGWLGGEPFYRGRPASYWAAELECWQSQDPDWRTQIYMRRAVSPRWLGRLLPEPQWPGLFDGDRDGLSVLQTLTEHASAEVRDWARIGIERIDNGERGPAKFKHPAIILTAQLFEVGEDLYNLVAKQERLSVQELEKQERAFLLGFDKQLAEMPLTGLLAKEKPLLWAKEIKIEDGKETVLLSVTEDILCSPSPLQLRQGQMNLQKVTVGVVLHAQVQVSADRRYVRLNFIEKGRTLEGIDRLPVVVDANLREITAEIPCVAEATFSLPRIIPDGGSELLPVQYRPPTTKQKGRWLVAQIEARIYIEEEERMIRGELVK